MKVRTNIKFLICLLFTLLSINTYAQVTFGSDVPPVKGAVLQVKSQEPDVNNITAAKGVLLPRVALIRLTSLKPYDTNDNANIATRMLHTGLFVYNTTNNPQGYENGSSGTTNSDYVLVPGVYTWDGAKWMALKYTKNPVPSQVNVVLQCPTSGSGLRKDIYLGETLNYTYTLNYTSTTPGETIPAFSTTVNDVTVSYPAQTLTASGTITVTVNGTPKVANNTTSFDYAVTAGTSTCTLKIYVRTLLSLNCPAAPVWTVAIGQMISTTVNIPYTNGYVGSTIDTYTTTVDGVTIYVVPMTILTTTGSIPVMIWGSPDKLGTVSLPLDLINRDSNGLTNAGKSGFEIACSLKVNSVSPNVALTCPTSGVGVRKDVFLGEVLNYTYDINYTSSTPGGVIPAFSTTVNDVTVSYPAQPLGTSGAITVTVQGKPKAANNTTSFDYAVTIGGSTCVMKMYVRTLLSLNCPTAPVWTVATGQTISTTVNIPYTNGYVGSTIDTYTTTVDGVTIYVAPMSISTTTGNIPVVISGTPNKLGTITLPLNLINRDSNGLTNAGKSGFDIRCSLDVNSVSPNVALTCPTSGVGVRKDVFLGEVLNYTYDINYTSSTPGAVIPAFSTTVNDVTVSYPSQTLSGSGKITVTVNGTPKVANNTTSFDYAVTAGGSTCMMKIYVRTLVQLACPAAGSYVADLAYNKPIPANTEYQLSYSNEYAGSKIEAFSKTVNGVTLTINETVLTAGGKIIVKLSGTPNKVGTISISLDLINSDANGLTNSGKAGFGITCSLDINSKNITPLISVTCPTGIINRRDIFLGETINYSYDVAYTSTTPGTILPAFSFNDGEVTISYPATNLVASGGKIPVTVTGRPTAVGTKTLNATFGTTDCPFTLNTVALPTFTCPTSDLYPGLTQGNAIPAGVTTTIPYTGAFPGSTISGSVTQGGITLTVDPTVVPVSGSGNLIVKISGTPNTNSLINFDLSLTITDSYGLTNVGKPAYKTGCSGLFTESKSLACYGSDLPNCYMVSPGTTTITFPVLKAFVGWENQVYLKANRSSWQDALGYPASTVTTDMEWSTYQPGYVSATEIIGTGRDAQIKVTLKNTNTPGSFMINYKVGGYIIWTWHIWVTPYSPNPATSFIMNQNLGAQCGITPTGGVSDRGFFYQWGRKDPIPQSLALRSTAPNVAVTGTNQTRVYDKYGSEYNSSMPTYGMNVLGQISPSSSIYMQNVINLPFVIYGSNVFGNEGDWYSYSGNTTTGIAGTLDNTLWGGSTQLEKGLFDPCPPGWKVPTNQELNASGMYSATGLLANTAVQPTNSATRAGYASTSDGSGLIPFAGYFNASVPGGSYFGVGYIASYWTATKASKITAAYTPFRSHIYKQNNIQTTGNMVSGSAGAGTNDATIVSGLGNSYGQSIRCVRGNCAP